jgi:hypothetical protein
MKRCVGLAVIRDNLVNIARALPSKPSDHPCQLHCQPALVRLARRFHQIHFLRRPLGLGKQILNQFPLPVTQPHANS